MRKLQILMLSAAALVLAGQAQAAKILGVIDGMNTWDTPEMFSLEVTEATAGESVKWVQYDLANGMFFDFDNEGNYMDLGLPDPILGTLVGVNAGDISYTYLNEKADQPQNFYSLRINFDPGTFGLGDFMSFAVDTDFPSPTPGGLFDGSSLSVMMWNGDTGHSTFTDVSRTRSEVEVTTAVPEPTAALVFGIGAVLHGVAIRKRR